MAKPKRARRRTDDQYIEGVERIDASPAEIARALFEPNDRRVRQTAEDRRKQTARKPR